MPWPDRRSTGHTFVVEGPQVFAGSAPAPDDQYFGIALIDKELNGFHDFYRRELALHAGRREQSAQGDAAPRPDLAHVVPRRAPRRGDYAYAAWQAG